MPRKKKKSKYAVLFGFDSKDKDRTGYLKVGPDGCSVVENREEASEFSLSAEPGKGTPLDWCRFFRTEPGVSNWRFHPITLTRISS